jgi:hypothetical protein
MIIGYFINKDCKVEKHLIKIIKGDASTDIYGDIIDIDENGIVKRTFVVLRQGNDYWQEARIIDMI